MLLPSLLMVFCWLLGTLFAALHACLENTTGASLESLANQKSQERGGGDGTRLEAVRGILTDIPGHAQAVALARVLSNLGVAVASVFVVAAVRAAQSQPPPTTPPAPTLVDAAIGVAASAIVLWIFTVSIAESIGQHAAERFLYSFGPFARAAYLVQKPLSPVARVIDTAVRRIAGVEKVNKTEEVASEIMSVAEEGEREGLIDEGERRMIEAVVNFKHRTVEQIMTPRNEIEALEYTNNLGAITAFVRKVRHSRVPVYKAGGGLDDVIGFFYVKDLLRWLAGDGGRAGSAAAGGPGGFDLKTILRTALHVPYSKTIRELADEFVVKKVHVAVVVDEYGAVTGLVTLEDIVEDVFGDIQDEYEQKPEDAPPRIEVRVDEDEHGTKSGMADIDARAYIGAANEAMESLGVNIPESDDYDTVGGFVLSTLGHMPEVNETFTYGRMTVTVLEASPTRVLKVRIQVKPDEPSPPAGSNGVRVEPASERAK